MSFSAFDPLEVIFRSLDRWRNLPAYQLERRADIFFAVYLRDIVAETTGLELAETVIPELPIKRDLIWSASPTNTSVKVDYCLCAKDLSRVFFVELKTDAASRRDSQDEYLQAAERLGFRAVVEGVRAIALASTSYQKYYHLLTELAVLGFLSLPSDLESLVFPRPQRGVRKHLEQIAVADRDAPIEVIYVQPKSLPGERCIDFDLFANFVERYDDPFSRAFAKSLRRWTTEAGAEPPG